MNTSTDNIVCVHRVTKKKVFEQLMLAVACSARRRPASGEESISECAFYVVFHLIYNKVPATVNSQTLLGDLKGTCQYVFSSE